MLEPAERHEVWRTRRARAGAAVQWRVRGTGNATPWDRGWPARGAAGRPWCGRRDQLLGPLGRRRCGSTPICDSYSACGTGLVALAEQANRLPVSGRAGADSQWERSPQRGAAGRRSAAGRVNLTAIPRQPRTRGDRAPCTTRPELRGARRPGSPPQRSRAARCRDEYRSGGGARREGFAVHVPHYPARAEYPQGPRGLRTRRAGRADLPTECCRAARRPTSRSPSKVGGLRRTI